MRSLRVTLHTVLVCAGSIMVLAGARAGEIHNAAASGDVDAINRLLDKDPALVNNRDQELLMGLTPLHVAAKKGQTAAVELLLARGAEADPKWAVNNMTPLIFAAQESHADIVKLLLAKGANPNTVANGMAALHWVARQGDIELAKLLLDSGADVNVRSDSGRTPLHEVAALGTKEMAELLVSRGADINAMDKNGSSPWSLTVNHPDIAEVLRKHGATGAEPVAEVIVNGGRRYTTTRQITLDPVNNTFPVIRMTDLDDVVSVLTNRPGNYEDLQNPGHQFQITLPDRGDTDYSLIFQAMDGAGQPQGEPVYHMVTLDTIPPIVKIISPKDNESIDQAFVHLQAVAYDPDPHEQGEPHWHHRRLKLWINGEPFWDKSMDNIDVPRFPVKQGANRISIRATDEAGNTTEATVNVKRP